jgi:hypothetical protein
MRVLAFTLIGRLVAAMPAAAAPDCSPATIAQERQQFQQAYGEKDFGRAGLLGSSTPCSTVDRLLGASKKMTVDIIAPWRDAT